jgi:hypothetical protein
VMLRAVWKMCVRVFSGKHIRLNTVGWVCSETVMEVKEKKEQAANSTTYHNESCTAFIQRSQPFRLIDLRDDQKRVPRRRNAFLSSQLHSSFRKFQGVL